MPEYWEDTPFCPNLTAYEPDETAEPVGLLDVYSREYHRKRNPIGYIWIE